MSRGSRWLAGLGLCAAGLGVPIGLPATPVRASTTICVGIVVDYGDARTGSGANSFCASVPTGANGADVLAARARALGRPQPTYRSDGLLCTIDGYPNDGTCADPAPGGGYRFWSYWHQSPGSSTWTCSSAGPNGFTVRDGSVEGWSFQVGGPVCDRPPAPATYGSICRSSVAPSPSRTPVPVPVPSRAATRRTTATPNGGRTSEVSNAPARTHGPPGTPPRPPSRASASTGSAPAYSSSSAASVDPTVTALSPVEPPRRSAARPPTAALVGVLLAGGIGGAAWRRTRSGRDRRA